MYEGVKSCMKNEKFNKVSLMEIQAEIKKYQPDFWKFQADIIQFLYRIIKQF